MEREYYFENDMDFYCLGPSLYYFSDDDDEDSVASRPMKRERYVERVAEQIEEERKRSRTREPYAASEEVMCLSEKRDYSSVLNRNITLHPYQKDAIHFGICTTMYDDAPSSTGCMFTLEMGLGKTAISYIWALMMCNSRRQHWNILIVCPPSITEQWKESITKFTADSIYVEAYVISSKTIYALSDACLSARSDLRRTVVIAPYSTVSAHFRRNPSRGLFANTWDVCVFDEAHHIANESTIKHQAAFALKRVNTCLLTGTPINNKPSEILVMMKLLGVDTREHEEDIRRYLDLYSIRVLTSQTDVANEMGALHLYRSVLDITNPYERRFQDRVNDLLISKAEDSIDADEELKKRKHLRVDDTEHQKTERTRIKKEMLSYISYARLSCIAPCLSKQLMSELDVSYKEMGAWYDRWKSTGSAKMKDAMRMLDLAWRRGEKTLVFSRFKVSLRLAEKALNRASKRSVRYIVVCGDLNSHQRRHALESFKKDPQITVCFLTQQTSGEGLNITEATRVLHLDPWYNPQKGFQAMKRSHRIGQLSDVSVTSLVCARTIEEAVFIVGLVKAELSSNLLDNRSIFEEQYADEASSAFIAQLKTNNVKTMNAVNMMRLLERFDEKHGLTPGNTEKYDQWNRHPSDFFTMP